MKGDSQKDIVKTLLLYLRYTVVVLREARERTLFSLGRLAAGGANMTERIGEHLGNYRLVRLLGSGGFAEV